MMELAIVLSAAVILCVALIAVLHSLMVRNRSIRQRTRREISSLDRQMYDAARSMIDAAVESRGGQPRFYGNNSKPRWNPNKR